MKNVVQLSIIYLVMVTSWCHSSYHKDTYMSKEQWRSKKRAEEKKKYTVRHGEINEEQYVLGNILYHAWRTGEDPKMIEEKMYKQKMEQEREKQRAQEEIGKLLQRNKKVDNE